MKLTEWKAELVRRKKESEKKLAEKEATGRQERNAKFLAQLSAANTESASRLEARKLLESVGAGVVKQDDQSVKSARRLLGAKGGILAHKDNLVEKIIHDPLQTGVVIVDVEI